MMKPTATLAASAFALASLACGSPAAAQDPCPDFEIVGDGPDLVLVPGLGSSPEVWDETVSNLAGEFRIHRVHVAGFAGREPTGDPETLVERTVQEIILHLECSEVQSALYVGHSMGGFLGLKLAAEHPERIAHLVVVDALPFYPLIFSPLATEETAKPQADGFRAQILLQDDAAFEAGQRMGVRSLVKNTDFHDTVVGWSVASDRATFASAIHGLMTTDLRTVLPEITAPTTVIAAANAFAPRSRIEPLYTGAYEGLGSVELVIIEDSYHFIMFDQPQSFVEQLRRALEGGAK